jgi:hypothetical protein
MDGLWTAQTQRRAAHEPAHSPRLPPTESTGGNNSEKKKGKSTPAGLLSDIRFMHKTTYRTANGQQSIDLPLVLLQ